MGSKIRKEGLTWRPTAARPQSCKLSSPTPFPPMFNVGNLVAIFLFWDRVPARALIMGARLPNIEYGGQGATLGSVFAFS